MIINNDEVELLNKWLTKDQTFQQMIATANYLTTTFWDNTAEEIAATRATIPQYAKMSLAEYYAIYKCTVYWAILLTKVLNKLHGPDPKGMGNMHRVNYVDYYIYTFNRPWQIPFYIDKTVIGDPVMFNLEDFDATLHLPTGDQRFGDLIKFSLVKAARNFDSTTGRFNADLLNSEMTITIGGKVQARCLVKDFKPAILDTVVMKFAKAV